MGADILKVGDLVRSPQLSNQTLMYYIEHKDTLECPCHWYTRLGRIISIRGAYATVCNTLDENQITAFHLKDLFKQEETING